MKTPLIALLTDFGSRDGFTGVMKGVILSIYRETTVVDVANDIPAQDIRHASWVLAQAFEAFPSETVFLAVIDPYVGSPTQRKLLLSFESAGKYVVMPDNGLATRVLHRHDDVRCFSLENPAYFRSQQQPSMTFHGRDIYAPVAAHVTQAMQERSLAPLCQAVGPEVPITTLASLELPVARKLSETCIEGQVDVIDVYGNLVTNIPISWVDGDNVIYTLKFPENEVRAVSALNYSGYQAAIEDVPHCFKIVPGSHGMLEIALAGKSGQDALRMKQGVTFRLNKQP